MTHSCCFDVLGIAPGASETEIKKAFRRKAVRVHPDKVPQDRKEEANRAFRELHEAYEEAIEHSHNRGAYPAYSDFSSPKKPSPSKGKRNKRASDSDIKKKFNDICEELKRESSTSWNESLLEYTRQARAAWPNKETCWNIVNHSFMLTEIIKALTLDNPELAAYLKKRRDDKRRVFVAKEENELRLRVEKINREWPIRKNELRQWIKSRDVWASEWKKTADRVINQEAARHIRLWVAERNAELDREVMETCKAAAEEIVRVYPDQARIRSILKSHFTWERKNICNLLPDDIRAALTIMSNKEPSPQRTRQECKKQAEERKGGKPYSFALFFVHIVVLLVTATLGRRAD